MTYASEGLMGELRETAHQFSEDLVMDSVAARLAFGLDPTPWERLF